MVASAIGDAHTDRAYGAAASGFSNLGPTDKEKFPSADFIYRAYVGLEKSDRVIRCAKHLLKFNHKAVEVIGKHHKYAVGSGQNPALLSASDKSFSVAEESAKLEHYRKTAR